MVFGIFTNLAINKDKVIKMLSLLHVIWTIWEVSQMIRHLLIVGPVLEAAFSQWDSFPPLRKFVCVTCQTTIFQENWYFLLLINTLFVWRLVVANLIVVEILFFLVSPYENLGELCMHFELQVSSPWTNLAEIWPLCCQIAYPQIRVCKF